jgi:hypothetical protein
MMAMSVMASIEGLLPVVSMSIMAYKQGKNTGLKDII